MITHLKGIVEEVLDNQLTLDVGGVGYRLVCSSKTISEAREQGGLVKLFTVMNVREDSWTLFGFFSERERFWFNMLNSVQGVGGKVAIAILSALSDEEIYNAFLAEDRNVFTRADGVGVKLATRIVSELRDKVVGKVDIGVTVNSGKVVQSGIVGDVISALTNLGYQKAEVFRAIASDADAETEKFDVLLKRTLNKLSSGV